MFLNAYLSFLFSKNRVSEAFLAIGRSVTEKDIISKKMLSITKFMSNLSHCTNSINIEDRENLPMG